LEPEALEPWGFVPLHGRGSLPFLLVHGESLVAAASWALTRAGAELFDYDTPLEALRGSGRMLVVHDPLCPLTPVDFLEQAITRCARTAAVVAGVRPVTDTVKEFDGHLLGATLDRAELVEVASPVVLPAAIVEELERLPVEDLATFVDRLRTTAPVELLPAPPLARRIAGQDDLAVLEALSAATG
jgi:2-C-methyl-D-erythritol 4-phosphate cytidylyltransferase